MLALFTYLLYCKCTTIERIRYCACWLNYYYLLSFLGAWLIVARRQLSFVYSRHLEPYVKKNLSWVWGTEQSKTRSSLIQENSSDWWVAFYCIECTTEYGKLTTELKLTDWSFVTGLCSKNWATIPIHKRQEQEPHTPHGLVFCPFDLTYLLCRPLG